MRTRSMEGSTSSTTWRWRQDTDGHASSRLRGMTRRRTSDATVNPVVEDMSDAIVEGMTMSSSSASRAEARR